MIYMFTLTNIYIFTLDNKKKKKLTNFMPIHYRLEDILTLFNTKRLYYRYIIKKNQLLRNPSN